MPQVMPGSLMTPIKPSFQFCLVGSQVIQEAKHNWNSGADFRVLCPHTLSSSPEPRPRCSSFRCSVTRWVWLLDNQGELGRSFWTYSEQVDTGVSRAQKEKNKTKQCSGLAPCYRFITASPTATSPQSHFMLFWLPAVTLGSEISEYSTIRHFEREEP